VEGKTIKTLVISNTIQKKQTIIELNENFTKEIANILEAFFFKKMI
jgi:hypothetical protein